MWVSAKARFLSTSAEDNELGNLVFRDHAQAPSGTMAALSSSRSVFVYRAFQNYLLETLCCPASPIIKPFICLAPHNLGGRGAGVIMTLLNNSWLLAIIAWMPRTRNRSHFEQRLMTFSKHSPKKVSMMNTIIMCHDLSYNGHYPCQVEGECFYETL